MQTKISLPRRQTGCPFRAVNFKLDRTGVRSLQKQKHFYTYILLYFISNHCSSVQILIHS